MRFTFKADKTTVSGNKTREKTTEHRNKIVYGWVDPIDSGYLEDIVQTINEALEKKVLLGVFGRLETMFSKEGQRNCTWHALSFRQ